MSEKIKQAEIFLERKKYDNVIDVLSKITEYSDSEAHLEARVEFLLGKAYFNKGLKKDAVSHFLLAIQEARTLEGSLQRQTQIAAQEMTGKIFGELGDQFSAEKYSREAGELRSKYFQEDIGPYLSSSGYTVQFKVKYQNRGVDILASKGRFRKKLIAIWFAASEAEIDNIVWLTRDMPVKPRYIFLQMGDVSTIRPHKDIAIIQSVDDIEV